MERSTPEQWKDDLDTQIYVDATRTALNESDLVDLLSDEEVPSPSTPQPKEGQP